MRLASLAVKPHVTYTQEITFHSPFPPLPVTTLCKLTCPMHFLLLPLKLTRKSAEPDFSSATNRDSIVFTKLSLSYLPNIIGDLCSSMLSTLALQPLSSCPPFLQTPTGKRRVPSHLFHLPVVQPLLMKDDTTVEQSCQSWPLLIHVWLRMRLAPLHLQHLPASLSINNMPFMRSLTLEKMHMNPRTASKGTTV